MKIKIQSTPCTVPAECLIEDYQTLNRAYQRLKQGITDDDTLDDINTVLQCLAASIEKGAEPIGDVRPTVSSVLAMSCESGVVLNEDGGDIQCAASYPVSGRTYDGVAQCGDRCPHWGTCDPEAGRILLKCGHLYTGSSTESEDLLETLEAAED